VFTSVLTGQGLDPEFNARAEHIARTISVELEKSFVPAEVPAALPAVQRNQQKQRKQRHEKLIEVRDQNTKAG
jgi:hypothetical protein